MVTLTRAEGTWANDLDVTRRSIALALAGGYAVAAFSAEAETITTDTQGLEAGMVEVPAADRKIPAYLARPAGKGKHAVVFVNQFGLRWSSTDFTPGIARKAT